LSCIALPDRRTADPVGTVQRIEWRSKMTETSLGIVGVILLEADAM
jgi:hypothetical protein